MKAIFTPVVILLLLAGINNANAQCTTLWYRDADGDGYGNPNISMTSCNYRSGYVSNSDDCNDNDRSYNIVRKWYRDADGDGYGNPDIWVMSCSRPEGYVDFADDLDDSNRAWLTFDGEEYRQCSPPNKTSFVKHYADCSLNETDTIQIGAAGRYVLIFNEQGTLTQQVQVGYGSRVGIPWGSHARVIYMFPCWSNNPSEEFGAVTVDLYEDFYFERCTKISGLDSICAGGSVTLTAQKDIESVFTWYDAATGGNLLHTGNVYQTPTLSQGQHTYWISADGGPRRSFAVTSMGSVINNLPEDTTVAATGNSCSVNVNFKSPYATDLCKGTTSEVVFRGTGAYQTWVVPQNIYSINLDAVGARSGGGPGRVQTTIGVTPGETLYINVASGKYPNGGTGATESVLVEEAGWWWTKQVSGGNGGGSTQVGRTGNMFTDTIVVAGGGGGHAYRWIENQIGTIGFGGNGGYVVDAVLSQPNFMQGMSAPSDYDVTDLQVGGGGGGGYYGGLVDVLDGDGASPGQGGGSHVVVTGTSNTIFTEGYGGDHSYVRITYVKEFPMVQIAGLPSGSSFPIGTTTNTFKYTNSNGAETTCSFDVTVTGTSQTWYLDADNDGHYLSSTSSCASPGTGYNTTATIQGDCDDSDPDVWISGFAYRDIDGDGYTIGSAVSVCYGSTFPAGYSLTSSGTDCDDTNAAITTQCYCYAYVDNDGDGYGESSSAVQVSCGEGIPGRVGIGGDCNDNNPAIHPNATEVCGNGIDENCNGSTDDVCPCYAYLDNDGDGYGDNASAIQVTCGEGIPGRVGIGGDCNDNNPAIHPNATEICGNGIDENCNGNADDVCPCYAYLDNDGDGYGEISSAIPVPCGMGIPGRIGIGGDCNDNNAAIHPGATEICGNGIDENCNGNADDVCPCYAYLDNDGDGYGEISSAIPVPCGTGIPGRIGIGGDCNDNNAAIHPGATEICGNGIDENCNGNADDVCPCYAYLDNDGDGYGEISSAIPVPCGMGIPGRIGIGGDCNDNNAAIHPGATEICGNGIDENCNGNADDICPCTSSTTATSITSNKTGNVVCVGSSIALTGNGGTLGTGAIWKWYEGGCGNGVSIGTGNSITLTPAAGNHDYYVRAEGTCGNTICANITVTSQPVPATPGIISGANAACRSQQSIVYSINAVPGATSYTWVLPAGATGSSSTNSITLSFSNKYNTGTLTVKANNSCGSSALSSKTITALTTVPSAPGVISGSSTLCAPATTTYSVGAVSNAASYTWTVSGTGLSIASGQGTNAVSISTAAGFTTGTVSVKAVNCAGNSAASSLTIQSALSSPGNISGASSVCKSETIVAYSVAAVPGAITYTWSSPNASIKFSNGGVASNPLTTASNSVTVNYASVAAGKVTINVHANNNCGSSADRSLVVNVNNKCGNATLTIKTTPDNMPERQPQVSVFPNPANSITTIDLLGFTGLINLRIMNQQGLVIREEKIRSATPGRIQHQLHVTGLAGGTYLLIATDEKANRRIEKLIIAR